MITRESVLWNDRIVGTLTSRDHAERRLRAVPTLGCIGCCQKSSASSGRGSINNPREALAIALNRTVFSFKYTWLLCAVRVQGRITHNAGFISSNGFNVAIVS
jgi:hypothetical protein